MAHAIDEEAVQQARLARLALWNRLFHGLPVCADQLDIDRLCGDRGSSDECAAAVALKACAALAESTRHSVRWAIRIAILYWFSNLGEFSPPARAQLQPRRSAFHLGEAVGSHLSWGEAVAAMGRQPIEFAAYLWVLERVRAEYDCLWRSTFDGTEPAPIDVLAGRISDSDHARAWSLAVSDDA